jgi:hypothetical protein
MTVEQFDNGYWYAMEIKEFAESIRIPSSSKLRKDELEKAIKVFLQTGKIKVPTKRSFTKSGINFPSSTTPAIEKQKTSLFAKQKSWLQILKANQVPVID